MENILIVDDDRAITASLRLLLKQSGYRSQIASTPAEALARLESETFQLVLQDMNFSRETSGDEGLQLLREIRAGRNSLPVILITAWGSIGLAVKGMQAGASDFVTKPWNNQQLIQSIKTILGLARDASAGTPTRPMTRAELDAEYDFSGIIGTDPKLLRILGIIGRVSRTDASVLITGESGTGKELIANAVHRNSPRKRGPLVRVNLGGIPPTLFESEMFGHVKGAFTDAHQSRQGRFELAGGGTIFLDEIGDLDAGSQVKLLRVLQDHTYEVLGSSTSRSVDVRVVSATNRALPELVARGEFREDLLYRLNLISVHLSALRERPQDILPLADHFLENMAKVYRRNQLAFTPAARRWILGQSWPGNIRQLKHLVERTVLVCPKDLLDTEDLSFPIESAPGAASGESLPSVGAMTLDEMERAMILKCLSHYSGNISRVAEVLGLSRPALYRRFEKYGIKI